MMNARQDFRNAARVTVMGLGLFGGGAGAARFFAERGAHVTVTDTADEIKLAKSLAALAGCGAAAGGSVRFVLGKHEEEDFVNANLIVANQAVRPENPFLQIARNHGIPVVTETGLALALNPAPWIGATGSSGKSTTASLLHCMLRNHDAATLLGGNIGGDLLTRVEQRPASSPVVVELSSYQLTYVGEDIASGFVKPPRIAVFTNITPNHLDWHSSMDEYINVKKSLALRQTSDDWVVLNHEDDILRSWQDTLPGRILWTSRSDSGTENACFIEENTVILRLNGEEQACFPLDRFRLIGTHNRVNAVQATAAAWLSCENENAVRAGLAEFAGLPHRLEIVGPQFINDSKATTPEATITALHALDRPCVLIAGGYDKHSPFETLGIEIQQHAAALVLLGAAAPRIKAAVLAAAPLRPAGTGELPLFEATGATPAAFTAAVAAAYRMAPAGGAVLLSPACASWGMFANYEERGDAFRAAAEAISGRNASGKDR